MKPLSILSGTLAIPLLLGACASPERPALEDCQAEVERGIGPGRDGPDLLHSGDRLLFEVRIAEGESSELHYLAFQVLGPAMEGGHPKHINMSATLTTKASASRPSRTRAIAVVTPVYRLRVERFDSEGEPVAASEVELADYVGRGQYECAVLLEGVEEAPESDEELDRMLESAQIASSSLFSMMTIAQGDEILADLLWDVIEKPSLFSLAMRWGVDLHLTPKYEESAPWTDPRGELDSLGPLRRFPLEIDLNDEAALLLDVVVVPPRAPWTLTSGIVALEGRHPSRDVRVDARLVATDCHAIVRD